MNLSEFLALLSKSNIQISVNQEQLQVDGPDSGLPSELETGLIRHEQDSMALLQPSEKNGNAISPEIQPVDQVTNLPLSFAQQRLWFLNQLYPGNTAFSRTNVMELIGCVDTEVLEKSITAIQRRHSVLRAVFRTGSDNLPYQTFLPLTPFSLPVVDLQRHSPVQREEAAREAIIRETQQPLLLDQGPLFRAVLYRLEPERCWLVLTIPHIIMDDRSVEIFHVELQVLYQSFASGEPSPLPELSLQYGDFSCWQRSQYTGEILQCKLDYWLQRLKGSLPILDLPADKSRPAILTGNSGVRRAVLHPDLTQRIYQRCVQEEVSPFEFLLAAFQVLLHRYTGQTDLIVGTPFPNRILQETKALIGPFANTLPLRTDLSTIPSFRNLLQRVCETVLQAFLHQDVPFETIVDAIQPERHTSRTPIFQVLFDMQGMPPRPSASTGLRFNPLEIDRRVSRFELSLLLKEEPDGLHYKIEYNSNIFEGATIERMLGHYCQILEAVCTDPLQPLYAIPLLTRAERTQILYQWNDTCHPFPQQSLVSLIEAQVKRTPHAVAVCYSHEKITYQQLDERANKLARHLIAIGVGPEVTVGVSLHRSIHMIVSLLGILKAGGAYVPVDPNFPVDRLFYMLDDSGTRIIITQSSLAGRLTGRSLKVVCIDTDWPAIAGQSSKPLVIDHPLDNLAYILYTSGSTGKPKGVQVTQRSLVNFLTSMQREPGITSEDILLSVTTLSFDIAELEIYLPLISGARVILVNNAVVSDGSRITQVIEEHRVTFLQATPVTWRLLIDAGWKGDKNFKILCGGEAFPAELVAPLLRRCGSLWNMYGPTETTVWSTLKRIESADEVITVGRPIANTSIYLLDKYMQPVPVGIPGELYIGGEGVSRGYLNRPELTAERFLPNPFVDQADGTSYRNDRFYRTGDLARFLPDGSIEYLGRIDNQVKVRGFRIELGEIESVLSQHPSVHQAVVAAREDIPGDKRLVAYLTVNADPARCISELRAHMHERLPDYMIPSAFVVMDSFPLTLNGKVDRRALPAPKMSRPELVASFTAPRNETERVLAAIWQTTLRVENVGINDNFFDLGGDSLRLVAMLKAVEERLGKKLTMNLFFQAPTIANLANLLQQNKADVHWSCLVPIKPNGRNKPFFCIHAEGAVLFYHPLAQALGPDQPFYALQARGIENRVEPLSHVEDMAALYIQEMRQVQADGPYHVGGFDKGGIIALEIARQLRASGERVGKVVLIETYGPNYPVMSAASDQMKFKLALHARRLNVLSFSGRISYFKTVLGRRVLGMTSYILNRVPQILKLPLPDNVRFDAVRRSVDEAVSRHHPPLYDGKVTLFRATEQPSGCIPDSSLGVQQLVSGEMEIIDVAADHVNILDKPAVSELAALLQDCLIKN